MRCTEDKCYVKLVKHILTIGDPKKLVNLGNSFGCTPLFHAFDDCKDTKDLLKVAKELIRFGADVNMSASSSSGAVNKGDTPLKLAAERHKNLELVKLLIKNGANTSIDLSPKAMELVNNAEQELIDDNKAIEKRQMTFQAGARKNRGISPLSVLPADVRKIIAKEIDKADRADEADRDDQNQ